MAAAVPSVHRCLALMDEFSMLDNIKAHSIMVARVADALLGGMTSQTNPPPRDLVISGALLHDIAKTRCIKEHCDHSKVGWVICTDLGYPEIAQIILEHVVLVEFPKERYQQGVFLAKEIVHYADKRVLHDRIVSLETRLEYIIDRYGNNDLCHQALIRKNFSRCQELEDYLFAGIDFPPEELASAIIEYPVVPQGLNGG